jgi:mutual gliding-motility protein MglA
LSVETHEDRTLFFDMLPVFFSSHAGFKVKLKLFTVPGQVIHEATRRVVLQNADAVAFIADSRRSATEENNIYWRKLRANMRENGLEPLRVPVVIQFNKRDLPGARTDEEMDETRRKGSEPVVGAVALRGEGVLETLHEVLQAAWRNVDEHMRLARNVGLSEREFLGHIFQQMDLQGTALESLYPAEKSP